jgi:predicted nucleic acid-binding protein
MILYLDASALVKRYIAEIGSDRVNAWITEAEAVVTCLITRAEVAAALTRANRMKLISVSETQAALELFRSEWERLQRLPVQEATVARADFLACSYALRGYDAVHLAAAVLWQEMLRETITLATYDNQLSEAARLLGMAVLP